jgi:predicted nucleic acid-binding protein
VTRADPAVTDASALAALVFGEPDGETIANRLEGRRLFAPTLLPYEMASVCLKKAHREPERRGTLVEALALLPRLDLHQVQLPAVEIVRLAAETGLTVYDAAYLWLAEDLGAELVTLDEELARVSGERQR